MSKKEQQSIDSPLITVNGDNSLTMTYTKKVNSFDAILPTTSKISLYYMDTYAAKLVFLVSFMSTGERQKYDVDIIPSGMLDTEKETDGFILSYPQIQEMVTRGKRLKNADTQKKSTINKFWINGEEMFQDIVRYMSEIILPTDSSNSNGINSSIELNKLTLYARLRQIFEPSMLNQKDIHAYLLQTQLNILKSLLSSVLTISVINHNQDGTIKDQRSLSFGELYDELKYENDYDVNIKEKLKVVNITVESIDIFKKFVGRIATSAKADNVNDIDNLLYEVLVYQDLVITGNHRLDTAGVFVYDDKDIVNTPTKERFFDVYGVTALKIIFDILSYLQKNGSSKSDVAKSLWSMIVSNTNIVGHGVKVKKNDRYSRVYPISDFEEVKTMVTKVNRKYEEMGLGWNLFNFNENNISLYKSALNEIIFERKGVFMGQIEKVFKDWRNLRTESIYGLPNEILSNGPSDMNGDQGDNLRRQTESALLKYSSDYLQDPKTAGNIRSSWSLTIYTDDRTWNVFIKDSSAVILLPRHYLK